MNQGKRYIRNTMLALLGATFLGTVANRIYNATVDDNTPGWQRSILSLGLAVEKNDIPEPPTKSTITTHAELAALRDFNQISVSGDLTVEIVSAAEYKVTLTPASTQPWSVATEHQKNGLLKLAGGHGSEGAALRIEAPALSSIEAQNLRQLTMRGWQSPELKVRMKNVAGARIKESAGGHWTLNAETPIALELDKATISGVFDIKSSGEISIHHEDGTKMMSLSGTSAHAIFKSNK
jgi:hypothetical protein